MQGVEVAASAAPAAPSPRRMGAWLKHTRISLHMQTLRTTRCPCSFCAVQPVVG